LAVVLM